MVNTVQLNAAALAGQLDGFSELLVQCVRDGASIGFVQPFEKPDARVFWRDRVLPMVRMSGSVLFAAQDPQERLIGTVQLVLPSMPNQTHKAEVAKMMVHPAHRRRGAARQLMSVLIDEARARGLTLLTLDTRTGDPAQALYAQLGFKEAGEIPGFAIDPDDSSKRDPTTYMYKEL